MQADPHQAITTLRASHNRLESAVQALGADRAGDQSYCRDWTVAQVLSHLGSGAEIALLMLPGALGEGDPPGPDAFQPVWDRWNAKSAADQIADALVADDQHISRLEGLTDDQLAAIDLDFFGMQLDAYGLVRLRLGEHAMHTWDVAVVADPAARVSPDAVELLIDNVPAVLAPRLGKPQANPFRVHFLVTEPKRDYLLAVGTDAVTVANLGAGEPAPDDAGEAAGDAAAEVRLPAEALLRLAYGRLDAAHTPAEVEGDPAVLDQLRQVFPGF